MKDQIEALEALHEFGADDLHFRYIGTAKNREFIVNVQFASTDSEANEKLRPEEYDFMTNKVLCVVIEHINRNSPASRLH